MGASGRLPGNSFLKPVVSQASVCRLENEIFQTKYGKRAAETTKGYGMNHNPFEITGAEGQNRTADTGIFSPMTLGFTAFYFFCVSMITLDK
jgi:hypothetical protein